MLADRKCDGDPPVNVMRFWSDLSMWNKYGLAAVGGVAIAAFLAWLLL